MRSLTALWSNTKVVLLMAGLTALLGAAGGALGGSSGVVAAVALAAVINGAMYFWSGALVLRAYGARLVTEREAPELHALVDRLRRRAGLPMPAVAIAPQRQPNAFATGRTASAAVVCVTEGLLATLDRDELEGVIAHELAHIKQSDMLLMTITATLAGAISNLGNVAALASAVGTREEDDGPGVAGQLAFIIVAPLAAMLIQLAISRQREFRADALGASISGNPSGLARALRKLEAMSRRVPMEVAPAVAPLAQVNPLGARAGRLAVLFSTHPPTAERVARLDMMRGPGPRLRRVA